MKLGYPAGEEADFTADVKPGFLGISHVIINRNGRGADRVQDFEVVFGAQRGLESETDPCLFGFGGEALEGGDDCPCPGRVVLEIALAEEGDENYVHFHGRGDLDPLGHPALGARIALERHIIQLADAEGGDLSAGRFGGSQIRLLQALVEKGQGFPLWVEADLDAVKAQLRGRLQRRRVTGLFYSPVADSELDLHLSRSRLMGQGSSSFFAPEVKHLKRLFVGSPGRDVESRVIAQDHYGAPICPFVIDPGGAVSKHPFEDGQVESRRVVLECFPEVLEPGAAGFIGLQRHAPFFESLDELRVEVVVEDRMVRVVSEFGAFKGDEFDHPASRALEAGRLLRATDNIVLRSGRLDLPEEPDGILVSFLPQNSPDDEGDGEALGGIGELGDGVDADGDGAIV